MKKTHILVPWLSLSFLLMGMLLSFGSAFGCGIRFGQHIWPVCLIAGFALFLVLCLRRNYVVVFGLSGVAMLGIYAVKQSARLKKEFSYLVFYLNEKSAAYNGKTVFSGSGVHGNLNQSLLFGLIGIAFAVFIAFFVFYIQQVVYGMLPVYFVVLLGMGVGKTPDKRAFFCLIVGMALALAWASCQNGGGSAYFFLHRVEKIQNRLGSSASDRHGLGGGSGLSQHAAGKAVSGQSVRGYLTLAAILAIAVISSLYLGAKTEKRFLKHANEYLARQHQMERRAKQAVQEIAQAWGAKVGADSDGKLGNEAPRYLNSTVMEITADTKPSGALYLKGFVGAEYSNGNWEPCNTGSLEKIFPKQSYLEALLNANLKFYDMTEHGFVSGTSGEGDVVAKQQKGQLKVEYKGIGKGCRYAYFPYFSDIDSVHNGKNESCIRLDGENAPVKLKNTMSVTYCLVQGMEPETVPYGIVSDEGASIYGMPDKIAQRYRRYAKEVYCTLPANGTGQLTEMMRKTGMDAWKHTSGMITEVIQGLLEEQAKYSTSLLPVPEGQDYVDYFLFTQKKGFCEHFATAGTLMLRACRVPARYVSGYKVPAGRFLRNADGTYSAKVLDSDAHAWTEYLARWGGWIPAEMTPGEGTRHVGQREDAVRTSAPSSENNSSEGLGQEETTSTPKAPQAAASAKDGNAKSSTQKWWQRLVFCFALAVFLLLVGLLLRRRYLQCRCKKKFLAAGGDKNKLIQIRVEAFLGFLKKCGMKDIGRQSEQEWLACLAKECGLVDTVMSDRLQEIILKAEFSNQGITQEEYDLFCNAIQDMGHTIRQKKNVFMRLALWVGYSEESFCVIWPET